jgi:hypothetical protein
VPSRLRRRPDINQNGTHYRPAVPQGAAHPGATRFGGIGAGSCLSGDLQAILFLRPVFQPAKTKFASDSKRLPKRIFVAEQAPTGLLACKCPVSAAGDETKRRRLFHGKHWPRDTQRAIPVSPSPRDNARAAPIPTIRH